MNNIRLLVGAVFLTAVAVMLFISPVAAQDAEPVPEPPGWVQGTGTHFALPDSPYLPVTLDSSVSVTLSLTSVAEIIDMMIEADGAHGSAEFTLGGLQPNTLYYRYTEDNTSPVTFVTDASGSFSYTQDLSQDHYVWIQDQPSTLYINSSNGGDCPTFGIWNQATLTCTMTQNVNETIWIQSNGITLDGNGYSAFGSGGNAVFGSGRSNVTVKNMTISGFASGIILSGTGTNLTFANNTFVGITNRGISVAGSNITLTGNTISANSTSGGNYGIQATGSDLSITNNDIDSFNAYGIYAYGGNNLAIENNIVTSTYPTAFGIYGRGSNLTITNNTISTPFYGILSSFGTNIAVNDNSISLSSVGVSVQSTAGFSIARNSISDTRDGIRIFNATGAIDQNTITKPILSPASGIGINLDRSSGAPTTITNNVISGGFNSGLRFQNTDSWTMTSNTIRDVYFGLYLSTGTISSGAVYRNNFIDITIPFANGAGPTTISAALPDGGNYYSSYNTPAQGCDDANADSICDAAFIYAGVTDAYPWTTQDGWDAPVDSTPPVVSASVSPAANSNGWNNSDVTITFSGTDDSGIDYCDGPIVLTEEGMGLSASGTCTDLAGNVSETFTVSGINIDKTAPTASAAVSPAANANGWHNSDVTVTFSGADSLSGIEYCDAPVILSSEGAGQSASGTCTDQAGNGSAPAVASGINIDKTAPDLTIAAPQTQYEVQAAGFELDFSASDQAALSGLEASSPHAVLSNADGSSPPQGDGYQPGVGVYTIFFSASDRAGNTVTSDEYILVIYDPDGGFVTGGGWIDSPIGAYTADPDLTGKATFGFVAKYKKGASEPVGNTQFQFKTADLNFHSDSYEFLVVAGHKALFKGSGVLNGDANYGFLLSAIDEEHTPSTELDLFRIKIWDKASGDVVYDNLVGGGSDDADPTTAIGGGSIVIHTRGK